MCRSRIYEEAASSACTSGFITHVEAMSPPLLLKRGLYGPTRGTASAEPGSVPSPGRPDPPSGADYCVVPGASVSTSTPDAVTATVCSHWAERLRSLVTTVQPSLSSFT